MDYGSYIFDGSEKYKHDSIRTNDKKGGKEEGLRQLEKNVARISELQNVLYADGSRALLIVFQAMDAAGKDGTIKHVFSGVNPQGVSVTSFKGPSSTELSHDYLWRIHKAVPARGTIGIFNRSHYEDVLIGKVLDLPQRQNLPKEAKDDVWKKRYRQICDFEQYLYENGVTILKFYLNIGKEEQSQRFLDRLEDPAKNWKFSKDDLNTSEHWAAYMDAFKDAINKTAAPHAPWIVVPADHKWFMRLLVSEIVKDTLKKMDPQYPSVAKDQQAVLDECRTALEQELGTAQK